MNSVRIAVIFTSCLLVMLLTITVGAYMEARQLVRVAEVWEKFSNAPARKGYLISALEREIGYVGLIHNFKNFVLRQDPLYAQRARTNAEEARRVIISYRDLSPSREETRWLDQIIHTIAEYQDKLSGAENLAAQGYLPSKIDPLVKVDDEPARQAILALRERWRSDQNLGIEQINLLVGEVREKGIVEILIGVLSFLLALAVTYFLFRNLTAKERIARELEENRQRFSDYADASSDWFWEMGPDLRFTFISPRVEAVTGVPVDFHIGKSREELAGNLVGTPEWQEHLATLRAHKPFKDFRFSRKGHDGRIQHISTSGKPIFDETGKFSGYRGSGREVTELVRAEERFTTGFEHVPVSNIIINEQGIIQFVNTATLEVFGYQRDELLGRNISMLMPKEMAQNHDQFMRNYKTTGQRKVINTSRELSALRKNGQVFPILLGVGEMIVGNEKLFIGAVHDLTELKQAQTQLEVALAEAEAANSAKSQFLANMSHELRTPLNAIMGFAEAMHGKYIDISDAKSVVSYSGDIYSSSKMLLSLVSDMLNLSEIEAGERTLEIEALDVEQLTDEALKILNAQAREKNIQLETRMTVSDVSILSDSRAITQIIVNLVSNSIKYSAKGSTVRIAWIEEAGSIGLIIDDKGVGIPESKIKEVTRPFFRDVDDPFKTTNGWGLGLAITHSLVGALSGEMTIKSEVGVGTTVSIRLPLNRPQEIKVASEHPTVH